MEGNPLLEGFREVLVNPSSGIFEGLFLDIKGVDPTGARGEDAFSEK